MKAAGKTSGKRRSWSEKLADSKGFPQVLPIDARLSKKWGEGSFVIPAPMEVDAMMRQVPMGRLVTQPVIREALAKTHKATIACPLTTGIFSWIAAHAAEESRAVGATDITPYWRTLKAEGEINPKYPGGIAAQRTLLEAEGHRVVERGKRCFVRDWKSSLWTYS